MTFSTRELKFTKPFVFNDTIIYKSIYEKSDTIIFYKTIYQVNQTRNLEQGYYNNYSYNVDYRLSIGSYHKIIDPNEVGAQTNLYDIIKSSDSPATNGQEFCFLGLIFDDKYLDVLIIDTNTITIFDESKAQYQGMNINEGIKNFTFEKEKGIVSFIDKNNNKWFRVDAKL
ncbi:hypothetical protein GCM10027043_19800 [Ferruginibacter profundus]